VILGDWTLFLEHLRFGVEGCFCPWCVAERKRTVDYLKSVRHLP
jgi:hypothetical protein